MDEMDHCFFEKNTWVHKKARGGLKTTAGQRVTTYHFIHKMFCLLLFLSATVSQGLVFRLCSKAFQHILDTADLR